MRTDDETKKFIQSKIVNLIIAFGAAALDIITRLLSGN